MNLPPQPEKSEDVVTVLKQILEELKEIKRNTRTHSLEQALQPLTKEVAKIASKK